MEPKRLYRSKRDAMLGGVAGGLADYFGMDPTIVRLAFILIAFATMLAPTFLVYLVLLVVIPENPNPIV